MIIRAVDTGASIVGIDVDFEAATRAAFEAAALARIAAAMAVDAANVNPSLPRSPRPGLASGLGLLTRFFGRWPEPSPD